MAACGSLSVPRHPGADRHVDQRPADQHRHRRPQHAAEGQAVDPVRQHLQHRVQSTATTAPAPTPQTSPTVNIIVNGEIHDLSFVSTIAAAGRRGTAVPVPDRRRRPAGPRSRRHGDQQSPRQRARRSTSRRREGPAPRSRTASAGSTTSSDATFDGNADARRPRRQRADRRRAVLRGPGQPDRDEPRGDPATGFPPTSRLPRHRSRRAAWSSAKQIGSVRLGPANSILQTAQNPDFVQVQRTGQHDRTMSSRATRPARRRSSRRARSAASASAATLLEQRDQVGLPLPVVRRGAGGDARPQHDQGSRGPRRPGQRRRLGDATGRPSGVYGHRPRRQRQGGRAIDHRQLARKNAISTRAAASPRCATRDRLLRPARRRLPAAAEQAHHGSHSVQVR